MVSAALRGSISPPMLPPGLVDSLAATTDYYDEPEPPETVKLDGPAAGRSADEEDAWRQIAMSPQAVAKTRCRAVPLWRSWTNSGSMSAWRRDAIEQPRDAQPRAGPT